MPKCQKAWTVAIGREHMVIIQRPSNRCMVSKSNMSRQSVSSNETWGLACGSAVPMTLLTRWLKRMCAVWAGSMGICYVYGSLPDS